MQNALLVIAKQPIPGQTKTRLCPPLTVRQAAELYECFLRDTLEIMREVPDVSCAVGFLSAGGRKYFHRLAPDLPLFPQVGNTLGERLDNLLKGALGNGAGKAVVIDSDSPTLPTAYLARAFQELDNADVVFGPAVDGGYYLIGLKQPQPQLLRPVQMSTPHVLADTLVLAKQSGLAAALLPPWYDIDTPADLARLQVELSETPPIVARNTRRWLERNDWAEQER